MSEPDLIVRGAKVITLDASSTIAEAFAVRDGQVSAVGAYADIVRRRGPQTRILDAAGKIVTPGFFDAHPHMDREGLKSLGGVQIAGLQSVAEIVEAVRGAAQAAKRGEWIVLMPIGAPPSDYASKPADLREGRFPTRHDLDAVAPDNPVYIRAVWGWWSHRPFPSVANSMALRLAGVTRDTPAPYNTEILTDERGEPTGVFLERNYAPVLEYTLFRALPRFTHEQRVEGIRRGAAAYSATGTTAAFEGHGLSPAVIRAYREVHEGGQLTVRMHTPLSVPTAALDDGAVRELLYHYAGLASCAPACGDDVLRVEGITLDAADPSVAGSSPPGIPTSSGPATSTRRSPSTASSRSASRRRGAACA